MGLTITTLEPAELAGLAWFLNAASLPSADLADPGRLFFRFEADSLVGYGGLEGEGADRLLRSIVILADRRGHGLGGRWSPPSNDRRATSGCVASIC